MDANKILEANIELQNENKYLKIDLERHKKAIKEVISTINTCKHNLEDDFVERILNILDLDKDI